MSKKVHLSFAAVSAEGLQGWAFVAREDVGRIKGRLLHSGCGATKEPTAYAACVAIGSGLRWLTEHNHADGKLIVMRPGNSFPESLASDPTLSGPEDYSKMRRKIFAFLSCFPSWEVRDADRNDLQVDLLARWAWEGAAWSKFPGKPTNRILLPVATRGEG